MSHSYFNPYIYFYIYINICNYTVIQFTVAFLSTNYFLHLHFCFKFFYYFILAYFWISLSIYTFCNFTFYLLWTNYFIGGILYRLWTNELNQIENTTKCRYVTPKCSYVLCKIKLFYIYQMSITAHNLTKIVASNKC